MAKVFLLVDDDCDDTELFQEALFAADSSIIFYSASHGNEAIRKLNDPTFAKPDIIFLDVNMPIMDGWECLKEIKKIALYKHTPVIMYSTAANQREIQTAFECGALCFFTKPTIFNELKINLKTISENLGGDLSQVVGDLKGIKYNKSYPGTHLQLFK